MNFDRGYKDFATFFNKTDLSRYVIRAWSIIDGEDVPCLYRIIGYTMIPNDILLHVVDMDNRKPEEDIDMLVGTDGVFFISLAKAIKDYGLELLPEDQLNEEG